MIQWILHAGKKILYVSYQGLSTTDALLDRAREAAEHVQRSGGHILAIYDFNGGTVTAEYMERIAALAKPLVPLVDKRAYLGISGVKALLLKTYMAFMGTSGTSRIFADKEEALAWLTS